MSSDKNTARPKIVIVGGGFAGMNLAKKLKGQPVDIMLIDRHNYHTFQPLLYQVATGAIGADTIAFPLRRTFQKQKNLAFHIAEIIKVNAETNTIVTNIGDFTYDYLVLATGATTNFFDNKQLEHFAMGMKSVPEALNLRSMILQNLESATIEKDPEKKDAFMTFVIVGGGPTGAELAGSLAELKNKILPKDYPLLDKNLMKVYIIESKPTVLAVMSEEASAKAHQFLEELGVIMYNGIRVKSYDGETLDTSDGRIFKTKNVIWAAGVVGEVPQGFSKEQLQPGNRIETDEINRVKSYKNIFAIGDVACVITPDTPKGHPGVAQVAIQQGGHLAKNLIAIIEGKETTPFKYFDKGSLATIGRNRAVADLGKIKLQGFIAWILWSIVHLLFLVGFKNRVFVFTDWVVKYFSYNTSTRLIIRPFSRELMTEDTAAK